MAGKFRENGGKISQKWRENFAKMAGKHCKNGGKILEIMVERIDGILT